MSPAWISLACALTASAFAYGSQDGPPVIDPPLEAAPVRKGPPVGFVTHPHEGVSASRIDRLGDFPATVDLSNVEGPPVLDQCKC